ncbi:Hypothetical predicted protein [Lynx pardinus]|uniref:Uncharacterized protein n=1 Tax=Lynx pardinus TaxID=191816 RepID=A0A485MFZ6_LYNPA|nr:Hypothetical predicted protein [Lynx pardinus]
MSRAMSPRPLGQREAPRVVHTGPNSQVREDPCFVQSWGQQTEPPRAGLPCRVIGAAHCAAGICSGGRVNMTCPSGSFAGQVRRAPGLAQIPALPLARCATLGSTLSARSPMWGSNPQTVRS